MTSTGTLAWSDELAFQVAVIQGRAPSTSGVYEILQSTEYQRYRGSARTLKIGMSEASLRKELLNHLVRHTAANRLTRVRNAHGLQVTFRFACLPPEEAGEAEKRLLRDIEDAHWELPLLNSTRGYKRGADRHYCK